MHSSRNLASSAVENRVPSVARAVGLIAAITLASGCTSTYLGRWIRWNFSDVGDLHRFPSRTVENAPPPFDFAPPVGPSEITVQIERDGERRRWGLDELAAATGTNALLIVRRDTLLYESYFHGRTRESLHTSFSVAKSVTSLLVGTAIDRGAISGADDPVTRYLPELAARDPRFERITIHHLLDMRSGLAYRDTDAPWGDKPKSYYVPELRRHVLEKVRVAEPPGERWVYNTYNHILIGVVLERATGMSVAAWTQESLWERLGMAYAASWSLDGGEVPLEKMESGFNARAVDFAKLGRLLLRGGSWGGERVVSGEWIDASVQPRGPCELTSHGTRVCYQLSWWVHAPGEEWPWAVGGWGHLGQSVYVFPAEELVMVRLGSEEGGVWWPEVFRSVATELGGRGADRTPR